MLKTLSGAVLLLLALAVAAQPPTLPATYVTHDDIQSFLKALPQGEVSDKTIRSVDVGGYRVSVWGVLRPKGLAQDANLHQTKVSEIYYMLEGTGTLVTGGTMPDAKPMAPGSTNLQSKRIQGGETRRVTAGDVVIIPGHVPHQWSSQEGTLKYLIFRPDPESKIPLK
jgi:mannose-6-phosphate isomerase-like protein (cupin superfamily)